MCRCRAGVSVWRGLAEANGEGGRRESTAAMRRDVAAASLFTDAT
jgi:hypothetical protein